MATEPQSTSPIQFTLRHVMLASLVLAVAVLAIQHFRLHVRQQQTQHELERLTEENEHLRYKVLLQALAEDMKIPTEALHHRYLPIVELHRIRLDALRKAGVEHCAPIHCLQTHDAFSSVSFLNSRKLWRIAGDDPVSLETFWEGYARTRAGNGPSALSAYLRRTPAFRDWLVGETELVQQYVRPLLLRIAQAPDPRARYEAIEAMLLMGDRSPDILRILRDSAVRPAQEPDGLNELERLRFHDVDPDRARELIVKFKLRALIEGLK